MVSTADAPGFGKVVDAPWTTSAAKLIMQYQRIYVPVFFTGRTRGFSMWHRILPTLRMAMHMRSSTAIWYHHFTRCRRTDHAEEYADIDGRQAMTEHFYNIVQNTG